MSSTGKAFAWVLVLSTVCILMIWHVIYWHSSGMYLEMFEWLQTDKGYITVLYNLGLMLALGTILNFLVEKIIYLTDCKKNTNNE